MIEYLIRRFNLWVLTLLVLLIVVFTTTKQFPSDAHMVLTGQAAQQENHIEVFNIDGNIVEQFLAYSYQRLGGEFGVSIITQQPIVAELSTVLPASIELIFFGLLLAILLGLPLGVIAAKTHKANLQNSLLFVTLSASSIPIFWLGSILSIWFGVKWGVLPVSGRLNLLFEIEPRTGFLIIDILLSDIPNKQAAIIDALRHLILPMLTISVMPFAIISRATYQSMSSVLRQNYIRVARTRGLSEMQIIFKHALPNAMLPVIHQIGLSLGMLASYGIITEIVFDWPGIGKWLLEAILQRNYTAIQAGVLVVGAFIITLSILIDVMHTWLNPIKRRTLYG